MAGPAGKDLNAAAGSPAQAGQRPPLVMWPDEVQALLLKAAIGDGEEALTAFQGWRARVDLAGPVDRGSYRLFPLLDANLTRLGCDDPIMGRLRGVRRHTWVEIQKRIRAGKEAIATLNSNGIPNMASKGLALGFAYYDSPGLRPMSDVDLVVPASRAREAVASLGRAGWKVGSKWESQASSILLKSHSVHLRRLKEEHIDLHWHLFHQGISREADERFWAASEPLIVAGEQTRRPGSTDMLLHVAIHGMAPNPVPPMRWVADAAMVLRKDSARIDWQGMIEFAKRSHVVTRLGLALAYLRREMGQGIPDTALAQFEHLRPTWVENLEKRYVLDDTGIAPHGRSWGRMLAVAVRLSVSGRRADAGRLAGLWLKRQLLRPPVEG